jgi:hypothetical protein
MNTNEVAAKLVSMCKQGKFLESGDLLWSDDVLSVEPMTGEMAELRGKVALQRKGEWFVKSNEVHGLKIEGPYLNGDQFIVRFVMDLTNKESGGRYTLDELGVYTVKKGKITEERFFVTEEYFSRQV